MAREPFAMITETQLRMTAGLSASAIRVLISHIISQDRETGISRMSQGRIAEKLGLTKRSVQTAEKQLSDGDLVEVIRDGTRRSIRIENEPSKAKDRSSSKAKDRSSQRRRIDRHKDEGSIVSKTKDRSPNRRRIDRLSSLYDPSRGDHPEGIIQKELSRNEHPEPAVAELHPDTYPDPEELPDLTMDANLASKWALEMYNRILSKHTILPPARKGCLHIHLRDVIWSVWKRYEEGGDDPKQVLRHVFTEVATKRGLHEKARVTFTKLWERKSGSTSLWVDIIADNRCTGTWWIDPDVGQPIPTLQDVLSGAAVPDARGVSVNGTDLRPGMAEEYCRLIAEKAPELYSELGTQIQEQLTAAEEHGFDPPETIAMLSRDWVTCKAHAGLIHPMIRERLLVGDIIDAEWEEGE